MVSALESWVSESKSMPALTPPAQYNAISTKYWQWKQTVTSPTPVLRLKRLFKGSCLPTHFAKSCQKSCVWVPCFHNFLFFVLNLDYICLPLLFAHPFCPCWLCNEWLLTSTCLMTSLFGLCVGFVRLLYK